MGTCYKWSPTGCVSKRRYSALTQQRLALIGWLMFEFSICVVFVAFLNTVFKTTTIIAFNEDIQESQLVVFLLLLLLLLPLLFLLLLHRKLHVREGGVEMFFEYQHLIPFDDDEGIIHI
nr:unnamed protein product [Spirometra erinaceieuropaei]